MIPGTTVDNFAVYRGGYNCRHSAIPFKLTKSQKRELDGGGEIPPDETPIPEQKVTLTPEQKTVQPLSQAQKDLNLTFGESPLTPNTLKGLNVPDQVFILSNNLDPDIVSSGSQYDATRKQLRLSFNSKRAKDSKIYKSRVTVHEYAHRTHFEKDLIGYGFVDETVGKSFKQSKKILNDIIKKDRLRSIENRKITYNTTDADMLTFKYKGKFEGFSDSDIYEFSLAYSDTIASLTGGVFGAGHSNSYWKIKGFKEAEWFAHASENYWFGNPVFEAEFPELYNQMMDYYKKEIVDVYLKDYLK
jgi:hypothetical protein